MNKPIEVEKRVRLLDGELARLASELEHGEIFCQTDKYFRFPSMSENSWVVRLRELDTGQCALTFKSNRSGGWGEAETKLDLEAKLGFETFFLENGFILDVVIKKERRSFCQDEMEINLDRVEGLGDFLEIEIMTDEDGVPEAQNKIINYLENRGISLDRIVDEGYVSMMKRFQK